MGVLQWAVHRNDLLSICELDAPWGMECERAYWRASGIHSNKQESYVKHELSHSSRIERSGEALVEDIVSNKLKHARYGY